MKKPIEIKGLTDWAILKNIYFYSGLSEKDLDLFDTEELETLVRLRDLGFLVSDKYSKLVITVPGYEHYTHLETRKDHESLQWV